MDHPQNELCTVCKQTVGDLQQHKETQEHKLQFKLWEFKNFKHSMVNNKNGVDFTIDTQIPTGLQVETDYFKKQGIYVTTVLTKHLEDHNNTLNFSCCIKNSGKDIIYITSGNLLHPTEFFKLIEDNEGLQNSSVILLEPSSEYKFLVEFRLSQITIGSFKVTIACNFQTSNNDTFAIAKSIIVQILDQKDEINVDINSPFTGQIWNNISSTVPSLHKGRYGEKAYSIPNSSHRLLKFGLKEFTGMTVEEETDFCHIQKMLGQQERVTLENYKEFWHVMLWMEEISEKVMLRRYNMENVTMQLREGRNKQCTLLLKVPGLAEKRPSVIIGDMIKVRVHNDHRVYNGEVKQVHETSIEIGWIHKELILYIRSYPHIELDVQFVLNRLILNRMHKGVEQLAVSGTAAILFPKNNDEVLASPIVHDLADSDFCNQDIVNNQEQRNAIIKIINSTQKHPYIVYGPPGTGKTVTIVEAMIQLKKLTKKNILVCAPSNAACDLIAIKLMKYCKKEELIRIHASNRERSTITPNLIVYSNISDLDQIIGVNVKEMSQYRIVVTTLALIGKYSRLYQPDCIFIDEAAQASEPETGIALSFLNTGKQIVLAGDPKQLGPMTQSKVAENYGLGTSLLERLMDYDIYKSHNENFITMLKQNFRSHSQILEIPNELFYNNLLKPVAIPPTQDPLAQMAIYPKIKLYQSQGDTAQENAHGSHALEFCSVSFKEQREGNSPSFFNLAETKMVVEYVRTLLNMKMEFNYSVKNNQIGVVTPYRRQLHKIKSALQRAGFDGVEVGTTESFQGREKRVIIISTVRAQHCYLGHDRAYKLGFVKNEKRFNVALTRAISKLIVIGCPTVLTTNPMWLKYIELCEKHQTYFGTRYQIRDEQFTTEVMHRMLHLAIGDKVYN